MYNHLKLLPQVAITILLSCLLSGCYDDKKNAGPPNRTAIMIEPTMRQYYEEANTYTSPLRPKKNHPILRKYVKVHQRTAVPMSKGDPRYGAASRL